MKDMIVKTDMAENQYIDENRIRRNNTAYTAITFGIGLAF